jgi:hypothetical protein
VWRVEADVAAIDRLVERGLLPEIDVDNRAAIERALSAVLADALEIRRIVTITRSHGGNTGSNPVGTPSISIPYGETRETV